VERHALFVCDSQMYPGQYQFEWLVHQLLQFGKMPEKNMKYSTPEFVFWAV
jgi:hypothetical protein